MASPWEQYAAPDAAPAAPAAPWDQYADHPAVKKFGLADTWPARLAKSIYSAVTLPGDVAQGNVSMTGEDGHTNPEVINRAADLASVATPMSPAARLGVGFAGALKTQAAPAPTQEALDSSAKALYDKARNLGVDLPASNISGFADKTANELFSKHGITPEQAPNTYATLDRLRNAPDDSVVTIPNLDALRQNFSGTAGNFNNPQDQFASVIAKKRLADHVASLTDQDAIRGPASEVGAITQEANGNYAAARRSEDTTAAFKKLSDQNNATHSAGNFNNKTKQYFAKFLNDDKINAGFSDPEMAVAQSIVDGSTPERLMHGASKFLGGGGGMGMLHGSAAGAGVGASIGGPIGAVIGSVVPPAIGYGLRKGAESLTSSKVAAFQEMLRRRSPLGDTMPTRAARPLSPAAEEFKKQLLLQSLLASQNRGQ